MGDLGTANRITAEGRSLMESFDDVPGRFGFDRPEAELLIAEGSLLTGDAGQARLLAEQSLDHIPHGRPGWAASQAVLARAHVARGRLADGATLGLEILDVVTPDALRATTRGRLQHLVVDLGDTSITEARDLAERLAAIPPLQAPDQ